MRCDSNICDKDRAQGGAGARCSHPQMPTRGTEPAAAAAAAPALLTCCRYLSQMTNSRSWGSCSLWVLMYCHRAWMITGRVWVWMPRSRASRGSSLNWGG